MSDILPPTFITEAGVRARVAAAGEPDWLVAERMDALQRFAELPLEVNPLFTLYIDLRAAKLAEVAHSEVVGQTMDVLDQVPAGVGRGE